jgi:hypothetical protein
VRVRGTRWPLARFRFGRSFGWSVADVALLTALALVSVLYLAGAQAATAATAAAPAACTLLTPADLRSALHGTASAGDQTVAPDGGESICEWTIVTGANGSGFGAQLDVKTPLTAKQFTQQRQIGGRPTKTVKKLGDAAFSERVTIQHQIYDDLWVHKGKVAFRIEVLKDLGSAPLVPLARIVLTKLGVS